MLTVKEIEAKSILNKSKVFPYCLNPYTGCQINCRYCYAALFMRRYSGHNEEWGHFVDAKINAPELLRKKLVRAKKDTVWISSVCDPYQPLEKKYRLTRQCLEELLNMDFPVTIQTKSSLVLRDLDLISKFRKIEVGFSISTDDEKIARLFEPGASPVKGRLEAMKEIHLMGVKTFAFIGPLLPGNPERLIGSLAGIADKVFLDRMNYCGSIRKFYLKHNLSEALSDNFFYENRKRLIAALRRERIKYEALF